MLVPLPSESPALGWWTELSRDRWIAGVAAKVRADKQDQRRRENRRRVQRVNEALALMENAAPAYRVEGVSRAHRHLSRYGVESRSRSAGPEWVEYFVGRPLPPHELYLRGLPVR